MSQGFNSHQFAMSFRDIAATMSKEEGIVYTENQVRKICQTALSKLESSEVLRSYVDFMRDSI